MPNSAEKVGLVMYTGAVEGLDGYWVGVKYDEPLGKNDGRCVVNKLCFLFIIFLCF